MNENQAASDFLRKWGIYHDKKLHQLLVLGGRFFLLNILNASPSLSKAIFSKAEQSGLFHHWALQDGPRSEAWRRRVQKLIAHSKRISNSQEYAYLIAHTLRNERISEDFDKKDFKPIPMYALAPTKSNTLHQSKKTKQTPRKPIQYSNFSIFDYDVESRERLTEYEACNNLGVKL
jgi:hypothetical protein